MPRKVNVLTTCQRGLFAKTVEENVNRMAAVLDTGWSLEPDIVCLPEGFNTAGTPLSRAEKSESVPGPTTDLFAKLAREHRAVVICPIATTRDGRYYNSAVVIDRDGSIAGVYDKAQPVTTTWDYTEMEGGVTPGPLDVPVFDLDCGRIGIQTCFDIEFPETWAALERKGAELVVWDSAYDGGFPLRGFAYMHSYYVVSSVRTSHARIVSPMGEELAHTGPRIPIAHRTLDLDYMVCHHDFHHGIQEEMVRLYGQRVSVRMLQEEGQFLVHSNDDDLPLAQLVDEFGLVSRREYIDSHRQSYPALRDGQTPAAQRPKFAGREPYVTVTRDQWEEIRRRQG